MGYSRSAFSLVEMLVAMGIVALLATLGVAGVMNATDEARATRCLGNLRSIGIAAATCSADYGGLIPQSSHFSEDVSKVWTKVLKDYGLKGKDFISPLDSNPRFLSYAINDFLTKNPAGAEELDFSRVQKVPMPSQTFYVSVLEEHQMNSDHFHFAEAGFNPASFRSEVWTELHKQAGHYLFVDGHVERIRWSDVQTRLTRSGSRFVRPDGR